MCTRCPSVLQATIDQLRPDAPVRPVVVTKGKADAAMDAQEAHLSRRVSSGTDCRVASQGPEHALVRLSPGDETQGRTDRHPNRPPRMAGGIERDDCPGHICQRKSGCEVRVLGPEEWL